jgi:hypothetical protein
MKILLLTTMRLLFKQLDMASQDEVAIAKGFDRVLCETGDSFRVTGWDIADFWQGRRLRWWLNPCTE